MELMNPNKEYRHTDHMVYSCLYHVVYCPKYRRKVLNDDLQKELRKILPKLAEEVEAKIIDIEIMVDHIHMIIDCNPRFGITKVIRHLKGKSSKYLRSKYPYLKTKLPSLWTRGAFISTVGSVTLEVVKKYIQDQKGK